jgi:hypothetical protein
VLNVLTCIAESVAKMMKGFLSQALGPQLAPDEDFMDLDIDPEDAMAIMDALGEHQPEKLLDADFFNSTLYNYLSTPLTHLTGFEDDFDDDDLN